VITKPTVFIIGAGASASYGFPVGDELSGRIVNETLKPNTNLKRALRLAGHEDTDITRFRERLNDAGLTSIDAFLENNDPTSIEIGRAAIAYVILEAEAKCRKEDRLGEHRPADDHWLGYLWGMLKEGCTADTLPFNRVAFVTFNYDRVLETYFDARIAAAFNLTADKATAVRVAALPVAHLHGQLHDVAFGYFQEAPVVGSLKSIASGIRIVHEEVGPLNRTFLEAQRHLSMADLLCFLGFGYHATNLKRLQVESGVQGKATIVGSAYGMGNAERDVVKARLQRGITFGGRDQKCTAFLRDFAPIA
jgi:hypothetical protein